MQTLKQRSGVPAIACILEVSADYRRPTRLRDAREVINDTATHSEHFRHFCLVANQDVYCQEDNH